MITDIWVVIANEKCKSLLEDHIIYRQTTEHSSFNYMSRWIGLINETFKEQCDANLQALLKVRNEILWHIMLTFYQY